VRAGLAAYRREADRDGALLALGPEEVGLRQLGDGVGALEEAVGATVLGVYDAAGDPLAVKVGEGRSGESPEGAEVHFAHALRLAGLRLGTPLEVVYMASREWRLQSLA